MCSLCVDIMYYISTRVCVCVYPSRIQMENSDSIVTNRPIITGARNSNYFLAYLFRLRNMVLSSTLSLVFYSTTVLLSTILRYFSKRYPGFLEVSDFM